MAPHSSYKKHVKFAKSRSPIPRKKAPNNADSYANIVLHYLSKLKGLFQSPRIYNKDLANYFTRGSFDNISKPILKKDPRRVNSYSESESESKQKAYDIVTAAIQYGCANNIIEKVGNYFLVKNKSEQKVSTRRPTPGPDYIRCASCKNLAKYSKRRSVTNMRSRDKISSRYRKRSGYYDDDYGRTTPNRRKRSSSNTSVVNYCPKCYARMRSNRRL
ncbi:hypothetical protein Zmor_001925 [Zophobas morio]|uniref:Uncharacterized protein n=1 Tax=Zophobas morio TaxID=2755281 RepID=A0AA38J582_9CUCU|nr:hypothetical protein Zmor_001925 [Zophobas morio]